MDVSRRGKRQSCVTAERSEGAMCEEKDIFLDLFFLLPDASASTGSHRQN